MEVKRKKGKIEKKNKNNHNTEDMGRTKGRRATGGREPKESDQEKR